MANYSSLLAAVNAAITANGTGAITGPVLNTVLQQMIVSLGQGGYIFKGRAIPTTDPGSPDQNVFYIATTPGTYTNFSSIVVAAGECAILKGSGTSWSKEATGIDLVSVSQNTLSIGGNYAGEMSTTYDVTLHSGQTFASLSALLSDANLNTLIPLVVRKGGMSIKFVQTSDNNYVQYRLMAQTFSTDEADWQGVDDVPIAGSDNLIKSGGIYNVIDALNKKLGDFDFEKIVFVDNKSIFGLRYPPVDITNPMSENQGARCAFMQISQGQEVTINATGGGTARTWGFVDSNGNVLIDSGYEQYEYTNYKIIAPAGSAYLVINDNNTGGDCYIGTSAKSSIDSLEQDVEELKETQYIEGGIISSWNDIAEKYFKYIAANGQEYASYYRWTSDYIQVKQGDTITCNGMNLNLGGDTCFGIACYDEDKQFIPNKGISGNTSNVSGSFVVEESIVYIKISDVKDSAAAFNINKVIALSDAVIAVDNKVDSLSLRIKNGVSLLQGKKIALFGDSIFEIAGSSSGARKKISDYLAEYTGAIIMNFGFGGTSICNTHTSSPNYAKFDLVNLLPAVISGDLSEQEAAAEQISQDWVDIVTSLETFSFADCDIVVLGYGSNDYTNGSTIVDMQQQLSVSLRMIFEANPKIHIVLDLPHYRVWNTPDDFIDDAYTHLNYYNKTLGEYCDAIEETGKQYGVVSNHNLYSSGWNQYNMTEYFYHADGAHFLSNACEICAGRLFETLNTQGWK